MSAGLDVEKLAEFLRVYEVSIYAHTEAEWGVHFEGQLSCQTDNGVRSSEYHKRVAPRICDVGHGQQIRKSSGILEVLYTQRSFQQSGISGGRCRGFQAIVEAGLRHS